MLCKGLASFIAVISVSNFAFAQDSVAPQEKSHKACKADRWTYQKSIPKELIRELSRWKHCTVDYYNETEFGLEALIIIRWDDVKLSVKYGPPEASICTVEVLGGAPLSSEWYEKNRNNFVSDFFDMSWKHDEFPGPRSEYYTSPEVGTNAQFWAERDKNGNITWMRFSYAL